MGPDDNKNLVQEFEDLKKKYLTQTDTINNNCPNYTYPPCGCPTYCPCCGRPYIYWPCTGTNTPYVVWY